MEPEGEIAGLGEFVAIAERASASFAIFSGDGGHKSILSVRMRSSRWGDCWERASPCILEEVDVARGGFSATVDMDGRIGDPLSRSVSIDAVDRDPSVTGIPSASRVREMFGILQYTSKSIHK